MVIYLVCFRGIISITVSVFLVFSFRLFSACPCISFNDLRLYDFFHDLTKPYYIPLIPGSLAQFATHCKIGQKIVLFCHRGTKSLFIHGCGITDGRSMAIDATFFCFGIIVAALSLFIKEILQFWYEAGIFTAQAAGNARKFHQDCTFERKFSTLL